ncbi:PepSY-associated TM helix domain-containing protein [Aquitalea sp. LB_tupeE]|uniref:PepSY-associated TM helix domain-containing protein n=1 Tax=Aquitalea sp. LB_tupeE TaxID=2748078 RepID=UPI0015BB709F|nr:PepSY-associated TM helix domain-containing protein [Aquitalea sp. LB_tupeE]NWK76497.1 PepSY domain-containing protein [Aquitalea sp. LB_tupeE]
MKRLLFLAHRWLGIVLCLLLLLWSVSGLMMMYAGPSGISPDVRLAHSQPLPSAEAGRWLSLSEAWQRSGLATTRQPATARLNMQAGEAIWLVIDTAGQRQRLSAQDGQPHPLTPAQAVQIARDWWPDSQQARLQAAFERDASTAMMNYDSYRPFYRVALDDAEQHEVTISQRSGEVVKSTTRLQRLLFWTGSYLHFLRPLDAIGLAEARKPILTWGALAALLSVCSGLWLGVGRWRPAWLGKRPYPNGSSNPYRALWQRWHLWLGLSAGLLAFTWCLSGFLSGNPWQLFGPQGSHGKVHPHAQPSLPTTISGLPMTQIAGQLQGQGTAPAVELNWVQLGGQQQLQAQDRQGRVWRLTAAGSASLQAAGFSKDTVLADVRGRQPHTSIRAAELLQQDDAYYYSSPRISRAECPLPVWRIQLDDAAASWLYVNPQNGATVLQLKQGQRSLRWLFSALHNWDLPILRLRPLWDIWMLPGSIACVALALTAAVLGWRRLTHRKTARPR